MARGQTLEELTLLVRDELSQSTAAGTGQGSKDTIARALARTQARLWADFNWPHLRIQRYKNLEAGSYQYAFFDDLAQERVLYVHTQDASGHWLPVGYGVYPEHLNSVKVTERQDPVCRWEIRENDTFDVWPTPATTGLQLRFEGILALPRFTQEDDRAVLDGDLLVLYAAAQLLARRKSDDAAELRAQADQLYLRLRGNGQKTKMIAMGAESETDERLLRQAVRYSRGPRL